MWFHKQDDISEVSVASPLHDFMLMLVLWPLMFMSLCSLIIRDSTNQVNVEPLLRLLYNFLFQIPMKIQWKVWYIPSIWDYRL